MYDNDLDWDKYPGCKIILIVIVCIGVFGFSLIETAEYHFVCNSKKCEVASKNFLGIVLSKRKINMSEIEHFELSKSSMRSGRYGRVDNYTIYAYKKDGKSFMLLTGTSNVTSAKLTLDKLNNALKQKTFDIDTRY